MRVLVVTNLTPDEGYPARGRFVRDQVAALRALGVEVEEFSFPPGSRHYPAATISLRRLLRRRERFDVVHAHFGLAGWTAALAGARPLLVTFHGTDVRHPVTGRLSRRLVHRLDLVGCASRALFFPESGRRGLPQPPGRAAVLPCGADVERFAPRPPADARRRLGRDPEQGFLLFPADPERRVKRHDRAVEVARLAGAELVDGGAIEPEQMPDWVNAASAVLLTSENEGFGMVAVEALACNVPVLSTPVGIAPALLAGIDGCLVGPYEPSEWARIAGAHVDASEPRVPGRARAEWFAAEPMAARVMLAYRELMAAGEDARRDRPGDLS